MASPRLIRALPIAVVLVIVVIALILIATAHWRRGTAALAGATFVAGLLRAFLPDRAVGVLAVRTRRFDVAAYLIAAVFMGSLTIGVVT